MMVRLKKIEAVSDRRAGSLWRRIGAVWPRWSRLFAARAG